MLIIDGIHLYGKYKGTAMIVMGCNEKNQLFLLVFALIEDENVIVRDGFWHVLEIE